MKLNQIRDLIAVAERGSLRSAARHLGLAQPAITRSIRDLENELGVALFERRVTGVSLTPMGKAFLRRATAIQAELQRTVDEIEQLKGETTGHLSIALSTAPHVSLLPHVLRPFYKRYPDIRVKITEGLFPLIERDLRDGRIDFYIGPLSEDATPSEFHVEKLFENRRIIVGCVNHPLAQAKSIKDLVGARWVTTSVTVSSEDELNPLFGQYNLAPPVIAVQTQTALSMILVTAYSDLLTLLPQQWLALIRSTQFLHYFELKEKIGAPPICIVRRTQMPLTPAGEHLSDLFRRAATSSNRPPKTPSLISL